MIAGMHLGHVIAMIAILLAGVAFVMAMTTLFRIDRAQRRARRTTGGQR